jgi:hypothetical protein
MRGDRVISAEKWTCNNPKSAYQHSRSAHSYSIAYTKHKPREKPVDNEWEKEDEELDLEAQLFGRSKKRAKAGPSKSSKAKAEEADDEDMDDVRLCACVWRELTI